MKEKAAIVGSFAASVAALGIFVFSLIGAASDANGVLIFVITFPLIFALLAVALFLARKRGKARFAHRFSLGILAFTAAFLLSAFIPGLRLFPQAVMGGVVQGYQLVYGMSPYEAHHPRAKPAP